MQAQGGAEALARAVRWVAATLAAVVESTPTTHAAILAHLDGARRAAARRLGVGEAAIRPLPCAPNEPDPTAWLAEVADPAHRAAFRWWGSCPLGALTDVRHAVH